MGIGSPIPFFYTDVCVEPVKGLGCQPGNGASKGFDGRLPGFQKSHRMPTSTPFLQPTLHGPTLLLRPLQPADFEELYQAASDPLVWAQHPNPRRHQRPVFEQYFAGALASGGALAVVERASGRLIGCSRYYDPAAREVAIGYTFLARSHWGGGTNGELKRLMLDHAFRYVDTVWFHVGPQNWRSRKALEKIGAEFSHQSEHVMPDRTEEFVFYKITSPESRVLG